ncbi:MAG: trypsin-like peptidase domain-containing protein [bacterium]
MTAPTWWRGTVRLLLVAGIVWVGVASTVVSAAPQTLVLNSRAIFERAAPAIGVVQAIVEGRSGTGTGFVIDQGGLVLTAAHVVRRASDVMVELPGMRPLQAKVVGYDTRRDLALLRIPVLARFRTVEVVNGEIRAGEPVVVIGTPRGRPGVMTVGEIVAPRASLPGLLRDTLIWISAEVVPGNSGSPVLNHRGKVVGLVIANAADRTGFAVSGDTILSTLPELRKGARIERPWIGIAGRSMSSELSQERQLTVEHGAWIQEVLSRSPAAIAGLRSDDVIIAIDGQAVRDWEDLLDGIAARGPGQRVLLTIIRKDIQLNREVILGIRP